MTYSDPLERRNLARNARFADVVDELSDLLDGHTASAAESRAPAYPWRK